MTRVYRDVNNRDLIVVRPVKEKYREEMHGGTALCVKLMNVADWRVGWGLWCSPHVFRVISKMTDLRLYNFNKRRRYTIDFFERFRRYNYLEAHQLHPSVNILYP